MRNSLRPSKLTVGWLFGAFGAGTAWAWTDVTIIWQFVIMVGFGAAAGVVAELVGRRD